MARGDIAGTRSFRIDVPFVPYPPVRGATIGHVPIYEFECGSCGARFEELVNAELRSRAKSEFESARQRARDRRAGGS